MLASDLREIKKTLSIKKVTINQIAGAYINTSKKIQCSFNKNFLNLEEEEIFKYLDLLKKAFSCKVDDTLQTLAIPDGDHKKLLSGLVASDLKQDALVETLYKNIIEHYDHADEFCVFLFLSAYDIPAKGTDKLSQGESDEVYKAVYGIVCPLTMSDPGLSYSISDNAIINRVRDKVVSAPTVAFAYPDYNERCVDTDHIVYMMRDKKNPHPEFAENILGCKKNMTAAEQKDVFNKALSESVQNETVEVISKINDQLTELMESAKENNESPSVSVEDMQKILVDSGVPKEKADDFVTAFNSSVQEASKEDKQIRIDQVISPNKKTYKTPDISINVSPEKRHLVKTEMRDGKESIVISLDSVVEINGITAVPGKE